MKFKFALVILASMALASIDSNAQNMRPFVTKLNLIDTTQYVYKFLCTHHENGKEVKTNTALLSGKNIQKFTSLEGYFLDSLYTAHRTKQYEEKYREKE